MENLFKELEDYESPLIHESNSIYFRNLQVHASQVLSSITTVSGKLSFMTDYYLSVISNRINEVVKTLALVATICVPITVVAGVYRMNFQYMPELSSSVAYLIVLSSMVGWVYLFTDILEGKYGYND